MTGLLLKIAAAIVCLVILAGAVGWVLGLGPFNTRPSAAAKVQPRVAASVAKTGAAEGAAVGKAEEKTRAAGEAAEKRTEAHVAKLRAAPADVADGEFYRGVCQSQLYARSADCSGYGGQP